MNPEDAFTNPYEDAWVDKVVSAVTSGLYSKDGISWLALHPQSMYRTQGGG